MVEFQFHDFTALPPQQLYITLAVSLALCAYSARENSLPEHEGDNSFSLIKIFGTTGAFCISIGLIMVMIAKLVFYAPMEMFVKSTMIANFVCLFFILLGWFFVTIPLYQRWFNNRPKDVRLKVEDRIRY